jgi:protein involved in polysaccharide export with SLBB domain
VLDIYDFLLYGSLKNNIRLQDMDVIRIPAYKTRVEVVGEVKSPAVFEMKYNETLGDLIRFAGGFTENAYKARIKVLKNTATEHEIQDVAADQFENYVPATGDKFFIDKILDRYTNRITINGAVFRPGEYELTEGLTLKQLIQKADGLKEDVFPNRGYINRLKDNLTREMVSFNTKDIMSGAAEDIALKREDIVNIPSIFDLKEEYSIVVMGEVRNPTTFPYADNMSLDDAIVMAGGFNDGATGKRIEIARRIKNSKTETDTTTTAQIFTINIDKNLNNASNFELKPFDIISVFPAPGYVVQRTVVIEGEVLYPGTYTISNKNERISDLIKRAGGLTKSAYREGATLKRERKDKTQLEKEQEGINIKKYKTLRNKADSTEEKDENFTNEIIRNNFIGIDLDKILKKPGRQYDLLLSDGDIISIPKELQTVRVSGEVLSPSAVVFDRGAKFKAYVLRSGGFTADAYRKRSYITYANGSVEGTKTFLFFRKYPRVKPGAEIFIPLKKKDRGKLSATEIVAFTTAITTVATLVYTVFKAK